MHRSSCRVAADVRNGIIRSPSAVRLKSTTSSIRTGLRAEQGTRGRDNSRFGAFASRDRTAPASSDRFSRESRFSRPRSRDAFDRSNDSSSSFARRASPQDRYARDSHGSGNQGRFVREPRGPRVPTDEEVFEDGDDVPGPPLSRRDRRAQFWEENKPDDEDEVVSKPRDVRSRSRRQDDEDEVPPPIPYTTASSQFIYGANAVLAALRAESRKIYKLWLHRKSSAENVAEIRRTAQGLNVALVRTQDDGLLDRLSGGRPHNGVVLETSPLPARPVLGLEAWNIKDGTFKLDLARQSAEEKEVNGDEDTMKSETPRRPLIVFLDGITDEGNVGNIIRTAHFYGADAVAIATGTCAPISSAIVAKASAGACEAIPIFDVKFPGGFIFNSRKNGWKIYAAVAPNDRESEAMRKRRQHTTVFDMATDLSVTERPSILMLGSEGEGLRDNLKSKADIFVTIPGAETKRLSSAGLDAGVDSMNVASAAAVLINAFKTAQASRKKLADKRKNQERRIRPAVETRPAVDEQDAQTSAAAEQSREPDANEDVPESVVEAESSAPEPVEHDFKITTEPSEEVPLPSEQPKAS